MSIIELRDITKTYGAFTALNGVNLTVDEGTVTCVLGDNGAGKSTLIKTLAGLHPPTSGKILVDNKPTVFGAMPLTLASPPCTKPWPLLTKCPCGAISSLVTNSPPASACSETKK